VDDANNSSAQRTDDEDAPPPLVSAPGGPPQEAPPLEPSIESLGLTAIGPVHGDRQMREWALVLQSMSVWHVSRRTLAGWVLLVRDDDYERASTSIDRYESENRDWPPRPVRERLRFARSPVAALTFLALAAFFVITGPARPVRWFTRGQSVADLVLTSEPWRAVTALTLHADAMHVMGNVISGAIFASAVQRRLGPGGGSLAILASGVAGNMANALWHHARGNGEHRSIGASTAVFGAIGILAATQILANRTATEKSGTPGRWLLIVAPFVGGLALLGALGASPRADLGAHLYGFFAGVIVGAAAALVHARPWRRATPIDAETAPRWWVQPLLGALAAGVVLGSWQMAVPWPGLGRN
jgi:membrane associated rhomboid family serine protease